MVSYDIDGAIVTNCPIEYIGTSYPTTGTTIVNIGTGGATYNAIDEVANHFYRLASNAESFLFTVSDDLLISTTTVIDNQTSITLELGVYFTNFTAEPDLVMHGNLDVYVSSTGRLHIKNLSTPTNNQIDYYSADLLATGTWYILQVKLNYTTGPNAPTPPIVYVNGAAWSMSTDNSSSDTAWASNAGENLYLCNNLSGYNFLFRWHNALLVPNDITTNYNASKWRDSTTEKRIFPATPTCTTVATKPTVTTPDVSWTEGVGNTIPNGTATANVPIVTHTGGWTQTVVPTSTTTAYAPTINPLHEANCLVKYTTWPTTGTAITNLGTAGASYNGTAADNDYALLPSGATAFSLTEITDKITFPAGASINNFSTATWELLIRFDATPPDANTYLFGKDADWRVWYDGWGAFFILRYDQSFGYRKYSFSFTPTLSAWYFIQVTWDCSGYSNTPVLKINNENYTATDASSGAITSWFDDSVDVGNLWNYAANVTASATIALFRWHNVILTPAELTDNYLNDNWRMGYSSWNETTVPACTTAATKPTVDIVNNLNNISWSETYIPYGTTSSARVVTVNESIGIAAGPNATPSSSKPGLTVEYVETVVPNCAAVSPAPSVSIVGTSNFSWYEYNYPLPYCTAVSSVLAAKISLTETIIPRCTTAALTAIVSTLVGWTETVVPNCGTASLVPQVHVDYPSSESWNETIVPDSTTTASTPSVVTVSSSSFSWVESTVPYCATTLDGLTPIVGVIETTVPDCATVSSSPTPRIRFTETIVPDCATASSVPTIGLTQSWTQTVVPDCTSVSRRPKIGNKKPHARVLALLPVYTHRVAGATLPNNSIRMIGTLQLESE